MKHNGIALASWFNEFSTSSGIEVISPYLAYFFHVAIFIDYGPTCRILVWTMKNKVLFGALGSSPETNCKPGSPFETCAFLWTKLMTAGNLLHKLVFSDRGWESPSSHEGSSCHWEYTAFAGVGRGFPTNSVLIYSDYSHAGNLLQHKFLWRHPAAFWVLGAPWPVEMFLTSPSMPQQRSGQIPEVLTSREQAAASALRQVCAGKSSAAVATVDHKSMRPGCEP